MVGGFKTFGTKIWHSPSMMTYGSFLSRAVGLLALLPFILTKLDSTEIYLWYLFASIASLQLLIDLGFSPTFSRVLAYTLGGSGINALSRPAGNASGIPNWDTLLRVYNSMRFIYFRLGVLWFIILSLLGSLAVYRPISLLENSHSGWLTWFVVVLSSTINLVGNKYSSYLQGLNEIAILRRWEMITAVLSTFTGIIVLHAGGSLFAVVLSQQMWIVVNVARNRWLSRQVGGGRIKQSNGANMDKEVLAAIWPSVWRTGIGVLGGFGLVQLSGIVYAQIASPKAAASYFLALRLIQMVSQFSQAPFYSRLPSLARLYSEGHKRRLVSLAKSGMLFSYLSYIIGFITLGLIGNSLLEMIGSNVPFPEHKLWVLIGAAFFIERYGAMHINLYSTTNHIINHVANCGAGAAHIGFSIILFPLVGIYAFPMALLAGNLGFYAWYAAKHSYREFKLSFLMFERTAMLPCFAIILAYTVITWWP